MLVTLLFAQSQPPVATVRKVTDQYFSTTTVDPYRWMEQPSPAFDTFLKAQAAYADNALAKLPRRVAAAPRRV